MGAAGHAYPHRSAVAAPPGDGRTSRPRITVRALAVYSYNAELRCTTRHVYGFRAECRCGWKWTTRGTVNEARADKAEHPETCEEGSRHASV